MIMHKITAKDSILDSKPKKERKAHASLKIESIKFQQQSNKQASLSLSLSLMNLKKKEKKKKKNLVEMVEFEKASGAVAMESDLLRIGLRHRKSFRVKP